MMVAVNDFQHRSQSLWRKLLIELTHCDQTAAPNASQTSHGIKEEYVSCHTTTETPDHEYGCGDKESNPSTKDVRKSPIERLKCCVGNEIRSGEP